jgi:hypothetical protein
MWAIPVQIEYKYCNRKNSRVSLERHNQAIDNMAILGQHLITCKWAPIIAAAMREEG